MMKYTEFVGIDISKKTLDFTFLNENSSKHFKIKNTPEEIKKLLDVHSDSKFIFCLESTGIYGEHLLNYLSKSGFDTWVVSPVHIKRSQGLVRGKNDKIDSYRIAEFAKTHIHQIKLYEPVRKVVKQLRALTASREKLVKVKTQLKQTLKEEFFESPDVLSLKHGAIENTLNAIIQDIKLIEKKIDDLINQDAELKRLYKIACSVIGIGPITACEIIIATNEFKSIDQAKKFACYAGIAPFQYSSGTSLKSKARVSQMANKKVKRYLHLAALSAIRYHNEIRLYYLKKVAEGKHKMAVLNAVRNKIVNRLFACIRNDKLYEKNLLMS